MIGDGRIDDTEYLAKNLLKTGVSNVFCPQYRLAANGGRFPAHLQDAVTTYHYFVKRLGIDPKQIVLSGDSAGGNIMLALLRYIAEYRQQVDLPAPACGWLWYVHQKHAPLFTKSLTSPRSPWVNVKGSFHDTGGFEASPNKGTDYIPGNFGMWGARDVAPSVQSGLTIEDPYLNPVDKAFATPTPLFISCGEREVLLAEDTTLYQNMSNVKENTVELHIQNRAPHDILLVGKITGFAEEVEDATARAGAFLKKNVASKG